MKRYLGDSTTLRWAAIAAAGIALSVAQGSVRGDERNKGGHAEHRENEPGHHGEHHKTAAHATTGESADGSHVTAGATLSDTNTHRTANSVHRVDGKDRVSQLNTNHAPKNTPFTTDWYANHPNTWHTAFPQGDAWTATSLASATGWLGIAYHSAQVGSATTTADDSDETADTTTQATGNDADEEPSTSDAGAASQLVRAGAAPVGNDVEFLPLGVYALAPPDQDDATAMLQLAVSKDGVVRGSYLDLVSDQGQTIQGAVDKKTERVAFTIGKKGTTVFETKLADLTNPEGEVSLHFHDGDASDWTIARFESTGPEESNND